MTTEVSLLGVIIEAAKAKAGAKDVKDELRGMSDAAKKTASDIDKSMGDAGGSIDKKVLPAVSKLKGLLATVGFAAVAGSITIMTRNFIDMATNIKRVSTEFGVSVEKLSEWRFIAERSDVTFNQLTTALRQQATQSSRAAEGYGRAQKSFNLLHLDMQKFTQLKFEDQFELLVEAISKLENPIDQVRVAQDLWGESGVNLLKFVKEGREEFDRMGGKAKALGAVISDDLAKASLDASNAMGEIHVAMEGIRNTIVRELVPKFRDLIVWLAEKMPKAVKFFKDEIDSFRKSLNAWSRDLNTAAAGVLNYMSKGMAAWAWIVDILPDSTKKVKELTQTSNDLKLASIHFDLQNIEGYNNQVAYLVDLLTTAIINQREFNRLVASLEMPDLTGIPVTEGGGGTGGGRPNLADYLGRTGNAAGKASEKISEYDKLVEGLIDDINELVHSEATLLEIQLARIDGEEGLTEAQKDKARMLQETKEALTKQKDAEEEYSSFIQGLQDQIIELSKTEEELMRLELARIVTTGKLSDAEEDRGAKLIETLQAVKESKQLEEDLKDAAERQVSAWSEVWENGLKRLDDSFASMWEGILTGSRSTMDEIRSAFISWLAELIHVATTRQIVVQFGALFGLGGTTGAAGAGAGIGGTGAGGAGGLGGLGNLFGSLGKLSSLSSAWNWVSGLFGGGGAAASTVPALGGSAPMFFGGGAGAAAAGGFGSMLFSTIFPALGAIATIASLFGGLFGKEHTPRMGMYTGPEPVVGQRQAAARGPFGYVMVGARNTGRDAEEVFAEMQEIADAIAEFDKVFSQYLDPDQIKNVTDALEDLGIRGMEMEEGALPELVKDRIKVMFEAIDKSAGGLRVTFGRLTKEMDDPQQITQFAIALLEINKAIDDGSRAFGQVGNVLDATNAIIERFGDEDLLETVTALLAIEDVAEAINQFVEGLDYSALEALNAQLDIMEDNIRDLIDAAIKAMEMEDPSAVLEYASQLQQAIIDRYQLEISYVMELQAEVRRLKLEWFSMMVSLKSQIAELQGANPLGVFADAARKLLNEFRAAMAAGDLEYQLTLLQQMANLVNQALAAARAQVQKWLSEQLDAINDQIDALNEQREAALDASNERLEALREELAIAQQWQGVLDQITSIIENMRFTSISPLPAGVRLEQQKSYIEQLREQLAGATGEERVELARKLAEALQSYMQMAGELFQRPQQEYIDLYNSIIEELTNLQGEAKTEAERALEIQEEIKSIEEEQKAIMEDIDNQIKALQDRAEALQDEANERLERINETAARYLQWILDKQTEIYEELRRTQQEQIDAITDGMDIEVWKLAKQEEMANILTDISNALYAWLEFAKIPNRGQTAAAGIDYVPYEPYPVNLHRGEKVVTAAENRGGNDKININITYTFVADGELKKQVDQAINDLDGRVIRLVPELERRLRKYRGVK